MKVIDKVKLHNFKRFTDCEIKLKPDINILIGDNESGKSTILSAIDLALSGSRTRIESVSMESLFNASAVSDFLRGEKSVDRLPEAFVEIYFSDSGEILLNGKVNSEDRICDGLQMVFKHREDLEDEIREVLEEEGDNFPFEYYSIDFKTFSGEPYGRHRKFTKHVLIDSSHISNEYATKDYIKKMYHSNTEVRDRYRFQNKYREHKRNFQETVLSGVNNNLQDCSFAIQNNSKSSIESDLTILEQDIPLEARGKGRQCIIKTEFALNRKGNPEDLDLILLEEPENHLSHISMRKLVQTISGAKGHQVLIATHSNLICMRLDLRNAILLNSASQTLVYLSALPRDTAEFFMKASGNNVLDFVLSRKCALVEGDAEYILFEKFFEKVTNTTLENCNLNCISVGGIRFKRYLDVARLLGIKVAVITDNDGNYQANCVDYYSDYPEKNIHVFSDSSDENRTFEVVLYNTNKELCESAFSEGRRTLTVQKYMLENKAEAAFHLLDKHANELETPPYIREAIEWIKD